MGGGEKRRNIRSKESSSVRGEGPIYLHDVNLLLAFLVLVVEELKLCLWEPRAPPPKREQLYLRLGFCLDVLHRNISCIENVVIVTGNLCKDFSRYNNLYIFLMVYNWSSLALSPPGTTCEDEIRCLVKITLLCTILLLQVFMQSFLKNLTLCLCECFEVINVLSVV